MHNKKKKSKQAFSLLVISNEDDYDLLQNNNDSENLFLFTNYSAYLSFSQKIPKERYILSWSLFNTNRLEELRNKAFLICKNIEHYFPLHFKYKNISFLKELRAHFYYYIYNYYYFYEQIKVVLASHSIDEIYFVQSPKSEIGYVAIEDAIMTLCSENQSIVPKRKKRKKTRTKPPYISTFFSKIMNVFRYWLGENNYSPFKPIFLIGMFEENRLSYIKRYYFSEATDVKNVYSVGSLLLQTSIEATVSNGLTCNAYPNKLPFIGFIRSKLTIFFNSLKIEKQSKKFLKSTYAFRRIEGYIKWYFPVCAEFVNIFDQMISDISPPRVITSVFPERDLYGLVEALCRLRKIPLVFIPHGGMPNYIVEEQINAPKIPYTYEFIYHNPKNHENRPVGVPKDLVFNLYQPEKKRSSLSHKSKFKSHNQVVTVLMSIPDMGGYPAPFLDLEKYYSSLTTMVSACSENKDTYYIFRCHPSGFGEETLDRYKNIYDNVIWDNQSDLKEIYSFTKCAILFNCMSTSLYGLLISEIPFFIFNSADSLRWDYDFIHKSCQSFVLKKNVQNLLTGVNTSLYNQNFAEQVLAENKRIFNFENLSDDLIKENILHFIEETTKNASK